MYDDRYQLLFSIISFEVVLLRIPVSNHVESLTLYACAVSQILADYPWKSEQVPGVSPEGHWWWWQCCNWEEVAGTIAGCPLMRPYKLPDLFSPILEVWSFKLFIQTAGQSQNRNYAVTCCWMCLYLLFRMISVKINVPAGVSMEDSLKCKTVTIFQ